MNNKGQGALEYLLLVGGAVVVAAVVTVFILGTGQTNSAVTETINYKLNEDKQIALYGWSVAGGINNGLSAFYNFDNGTADPARKNNGTANGSPVLLSGTNCKRGSCFQFSGSSSQYISFPGSKAAWGWNTFSGPASIATWFKPTSLSGTQKIISDNCGVEMGVYTSGTTLYLAGASMVQNAGTITPNQWYHAAVTHEHPGGSTTNTIIKFYLNGNLISQTTKTLSATEINTNGYGDWAFFAGGDTCTPAPFFGVIDEVAFYNRALTESEVRAIYQTT